MSGISFLIKKFTLFTLIMLVGANLLQACDQSPANQPAKLINPELHFVEQAENGKVDAVELVGLDAEALALLKSENLDFEPLSALLAIYTVTDEATQSIASRPLIGEFSIVDDLLRFQPRYPFEPGVTYVAQAKPAELEALLSKQDHLDGLSDLEMIELTFSLPASSNQPNTAISNVFPSDNTLPENLLRFYVHFSGPMRRGEALNHIRVLDANGEAVERPFLQIGRELWNPSMTRLTIMLDPGRIKRDMSPNLQAGLPLKSGASYQLVIDSNWEDANGNPLVASYQKDFQVVESDFDSPRAEEWEILQPPANSVEPLIVRFPESMDYALLQRLIAVQYIDGPQENGNVLVQGTIDTINGETQWLFTPTSPWQQGQYQLVVDTLLEDVAGNSLRRPFDADLQNMTSDPNIGDSIELTFHIRSDL